MLLAAEKPVLLIGGGVIISGACDESRGVRRVRAEYPVVHTSMAKGGLPVQPPALRRRRRRPGQPDSPATRCSSTPTSCSPSAPLRRPPHRRARRLHEGPEVRPDRHRPLPDRAVIPGRAGHRLRREAALRRAARSREDADRPASRRARVANVATLKARAGAPDRLRPGADQAAARLTARSTSSSTRRDGLRHDDRSQPDLVGSATGDREAGSLLLPRRRWPARLGSAGGGRHQARQARQARRRHHR